jgi:hypothetical protein
MKSFRAKDGSVEPPTPGRNGGATGKVRRTVVPPDVAASAGYAVSQRLRNGIEEGFGWSKAVGGLTQPKVRGLDKVRAVFAFAVILGVLAMLSASARLARPVQPGGD